MRIPSVDRGAGLARRCRRASGAGSPEGTCPQGDGAGAGSRWTGPAPPIGPGSAASFTRARPARGTTTDKGFCPPRLHASSSPRHDVLARARRLPSHECAPQGGRRRIRVSVLPASTPPPPPPVTTCFPCPAASFTRARPTRGTTTDKGFSPPRLHASSSSPRHDVLPRARRLPSHEHAPQGGRRRIRVSLLPASTPPPPPSRRASRARRLPRLPHPVRWQEGPALALQGGVAGLQGQARRRGRGAGAVRPDAMAAVAVGASLDARFLAAMGCGAAEERASGSRCSGPEGFEGVDGGSACATAGGTHLLGPRPPIRPGAGSGSTRQYASRTLRGRRGFQRERLGVHSGCGCRW